MPRKPKTAARSTVDLAAERVACYCRVSTEDQGERQTIVAQLDFLRRYVDLHGLACHDFYVDDGVSGTLPLHERPEGRRLLADAHGGRFGSVLVFRLDRLGRNLRALLDAHDQLDQAGVSIRSATEPFDTSTPIGQFLFQLLGSLAELEKSTILERMTLGRDRVARAGKWTNGSVAVGYDVDEQGILVESARMLACGQTEADMVRDLYRRIAGGSTLAAEARRLEALGVPSVHRWPNRPDTVSPRWWPSRIHKIIQNPIYRGAYVLQSRNGPVDVPIPALVDPDLWERAQAAMTRNRALSRTDTANDYLLRGLARCRSILEDGTECGRTYSGSPGSDGGSRLYYHCARTRAHHTMPGGPRCHGRSIPTAVLEQRVWEDVRAFVLDPGPALADARAVIQDGPFPDPRRPDERERLEQALAARLAERERAQLLFRRGLASLDETEAAIRGADADVRQVRDLLASLDADRLAAEATARHLSEIELLVGSLHPLVEAGDAGDRVAQRTVIELLVREVSIETMLVPPTGRRQTRPQKRVRTTLRYRYRPWGHGRDGRPELPSIPSGLADGILGNFSIDREVHVV